MRTAFKEWAVIVDALGRGDQIVILRKGGISEGPGGFSVDHPRFLLFPTLFHQQRKSVLPSAQARFDEIVPTLPGPGELRLEYWAEVAEWRCLQSLDAARSLAGQHVWRDEVIAERFELGRNREIFALAVRVFRLPSRVLLPMMPQYGGCKSWITLETEVDESGSMAVLGDSDFEKKMSRFASVLK